jgi:superfamily II DNA or RNA helicase
MTDQDMAIAACVQPMDSYHRYRYSELWINPVRAVVAMIGHPHVYRLEDPAQHLELVRAEPEVVAKRKNGKVVLSLHPPATGNDVTLVQESPNRIRVVVFNQLFQRVGNLIGEVGIEIPATEKDVLSKTLASLSAVMTVHSSVPFDNDQLEQLAPQPVPIVQIAPDGPERFRLNVFVRPLGMGGPVLRAGKGAVTIVSEIDGKRLQAIRNLSEEKRLAAAVEERLLALDSAEGTAGEWVIANPEDCLQALADLRELQEQGSAVVEWPEGEKFKFSRPLSFDQVQLRMRAAMDWFEIEGELQIDEAHVIGMKQLIDLLAANPGRRFVQMEDGLFLSLTAALRKRLEELSAFTEKRGKKLLLHGLAAPAVEDILHPFQHVEVDSHWQDRLKRVEEAMRLEPAIPSTLKAALREYQKEGFRWMCRLAHLGCGACLADDMGLGKTVQAIAMLLSKAAEGPSLVVAPMSVCANWLVEVERFAPTLRVHTLHVADRKGLIEGLGPMDVLVTSYGLLHQEGEVLAVRRWSVVVLDEAQAIKNMTTKRYQAAVRLQGGFKLITTGTPVENHLGEFYTLFQFINPGLLGSKDRFNRRYVIPIEREHDKQARQRLRKLVKPFILRRLKSQVLEELPPKTDIVLRVALKPEEIALYEAMRQKAIDRIANMDGPIESRRFELLAEIMKLRQVCCHPKLIHPEFPDVGSKLESFGEIVSELLEGGHKALVFSQFLGHLALIRDYLDKAGIVYRYLDGKTPAKQRQQEIEAFQSGNGDLFLISLKAGGLGLNLTAADYVIHMDPWWNPAVEDQASDRAHRIGQSRSVTVYRLVAQGTIEEKIVKLHAEKRELAESLLEGTDTSARMGAEELLRLIQAEEA